MSIYCSHLIDGSLIRQSKLSQNDKYYLLKILNFG